VHLSPRAVQTGLRRDPATSPTAYLREVRLRRARGAECGRRRRDATTVRAVAVDVGMLHPSRLPLPTERPSAKRTQTPSAALSGIRLHTARARVARTRRCTHRDGSRP
jgi:AraC-like DNA-binding protein